jgi:acyl-CoA synthetase (AMP-forming)/AMP-acid ligase II
VYDCAVVGLPHPKWGDQVTAIVVLKPGQEATAEEITGHCRDKVAGYKLPRNVVFIDDEDMPRTATGKILHRILRERLGQ